MNNNVFLNIHFIIVAAWRRRYLIAIPILLLPIIGGIIGTISPKNYQTHMSFLIQETAKMNPFLSDFAVSTNIKERMAALNTLLHSRHILSLVAKDLDLFKEHHDNSDKDKIINDLSMRLGAQLVGSEMIKITYKDSQPSNMANILQIVSDRFIENLLAPEISSIKASEIFLFDQLQQKKNNLMTSEQLLATYKSKHAAELPELLTMNITRLHSNQQRLSEKTVELGGARAKLEGMINKLGHIDPIIGKIEEQLITVKSELTLLRAKYTNKHSQVQALSREQRHLERERNRIISDTTSIKNVDMDTLWNMANSVLTIDSEKKIHPLLISQLQELQLLTTNVYQFEEEIKILSQNTQSLESKVNSFGKHEFELSELMRDLRVQRKLYDNLLERYEMARVTGALGRFESPERIKIIDKPFIPTSSTNPPVWLFIIGGFFGGLALGSGFAILIEQSDTRIRRTDILENITGLPVLSRIPNLSNNQKREHELKFNNGANSR